MNYELKIIPDTRIAYFCWSGPITLEDRKEGRERIVQFCRENSIIQVIVDTREQINKARTMQMFEFAADLPEVMRGFHIAIVWQPDDKETRFVETVAANRGAIIRTFLTLEDAQRWLESKQPTPNRSDPGDS